MENPIEKVIDKIKDEKIIPESRFKLNWKNYIFWAVWACVLLLGALFFSLIILNFLDFKMQILHYFGFGKFMFIIMKSMPFLWVFLVFIAVFSGFLAFRKTKRGYRHGLLFITSLGVIIISALGIMFHVAKVNNQIRQRVSLGMPGYRKIAFPIEDRWSRPEEKMLGGKILEVHKDKLIIISFKDKFWKVYYSPKTEIRIRKGKLEQGISIGVLGEKIDEDKFKADFIHSIPPKEDGCCDIGNTKR